MTGTVEEIIIVPDKKHTRNWHDIPTARYKGKRVKNGDNLRLAWNTFTTRYPTGRLSNSSTTNEEMTDRVFSTLDEFNSEDDI